MTTPEPQAQPAQEQAPQPSDVQQQWTPPPPDPELMGEIRKGYTPPDLKK